MSSVSELDLFSDELDVSVDSGDINKMESFGEVEDTLVLDTTVLDNLNAQDVDNMGSVFDFTEEKVNNEIELKDNFVVGTEQEAIKSDELSVTEPSYENKPVAVQKSTELIELVDEVSDKAESIGSKFFKFCKRFVNYSISAYQDSTLYKKFEKGDLVKAEDFYYLLFNNELMVYKYVGCKQEIVIPDYVGELPVRYLYKSFLTTGILNTHAIRSVVDYFKEDNILNLTVDNLKEASKGATSVQLPIELVHIPHDAFSGCTSLKRIVIPSSVEVISPRAFSGSGIKEVYFCGKAPRGLEYLKVNKDMSFYSREDRVSTFSAFIDYLRDYRKKVTEDAEALDKVKKEVKSRVSASA